jgi:hypothetical protein
MARWPTIDEPQLLHRLGLDDEAFRAYVAEYADLLGPRVLTDELYERALAYPWSRPERSYLLTDRTVTLLHQSTAQEQSRIRAAYTDPDTSGRFPLLAFGSNGAPGALRLKFAHFDGADRDVLVLAGELHDFDVGASAHPTLYGSMPATLVPSPGTAVRAALLWVTPAQLLQLTWSEVSYAFGRLDGVCFTGDEESRVTEDILAYVSRFGAFCVDGEPVALAAIPATARRARALTQEELLDAAARIALGPGADARLLLQRLFADAGATVRVTGPALMATARPFASERFTPYPVPTASPSDGAGPSAAG